MWHSNLVLIFLYHVDLFHMVGMLSFFNVLFQVRMTYLQPGCYRTEHPIVPLYMLHPLISFLHSVPHNYSDVFQVLCTIVACMVSSWRSCSHLFPVYCYSMKQLWSPTNVLTSDNMCLLHNCGSVYDNSKDMFDVNIT